MDNKAYDYSIRRARFTDLTQIIALGQAFWEEARIEKYGLGFDAEYFRRFLLNLMRNGEGTILAALSDGMIIGGIAGVLVPWMLDANQTIMAELWWYVMPKYRGGRLALKLIKEMENEARRNKATHMSMVTQSERKETSLQKFYERIGYHHLEHYHLRSL